MRPTVDDDATVAKESDKFMQFLNHYTGERTSLKQGNNALIYGNEWYDNEGAVKETKSNLNATKNLTESKVDN